jgi:hypothetical protein
LYEYDYDRRRSVSQFHLATTAPTGRRRKGLIVGTAVILLTAGLAVAAATTDADAAETPSGFLAGPSLHPGPARGVLGPQP